MYHIKPDILYTPSDADDVIVRLRNSTNNQDSDNKNNDGNDDTNDSNDNTNDSNDEYFYLMRPIRRREKGTSY